MTLAADPSQTEADLLSALSKLSVNESQLTHLLVAEIEADALAAGPKAQAFDTPFRHSEAGSCSRRLSLRAMGVPETDPFDQGSTWVAWVGTMIHEHWQKSVLRIFGDQATAEIGVTSDIASGHLDMLLDLGDQRVCYELKTVNGFKYSKAIGVDKSHFRRLPPDGPNESHILQCALNADAAGADLMVIGYLAMESLSKKCAEVAGFSEQERILSEWAYTKEQFAPIAEAEKARMRQIKAKADDGILVDALVVEKGNVIRLDPNASRPAWNCDYCSHKSICRKFGPGEQTYEGDIIF
jgi:hypothetical protein